MQFCISKGRSEFYLSGFYIPINIQRKRERGISYIDICRHNCMYIPGDTCLNTDAYIYIYMYIDIYLEREARKILFCCSKSI